MTFHSLPLVRFWHAAALTCGALLLGATPAWALYKVVGPDGRVTYTDRAPVPGSKPLPTQATPGSASAALPYELAQVAQRYPVTLYTGRDCAPCQAGRDWLKARGVPFRELTINTTADAQQFKQLEGTDRLPVLRVGGQRLQGFQSQDWGSYLDLAGYPGSSQLPASYSWPEATPLSGRPAALPPEAPPSRQADPAAPASEGSAPSGFRF